MLFYCLFSRFEIHKPFDDAVITAYNPPEFPVRPGLP
jgi:hypothetical protein